MSDRTKKILLLAGFIVAALIFAFIIYYLFFRPFIAPTPAINIPPVNLPPTGLPPIAPAINLPPTFPGVLPKLPAGIPTIPAILPAVPGPAISSQAQGGLTSYQVMETDPSLNPTLATNGTDLIYYDTVSGLFYSINPAGEKKVFSSVPLKNVQKVTWAPNTQKAVLEYPDGSKIIYNFAQNTSVTLPSHWKDFAFSPDSQKLAFKDMGLDPDNQFIAKVDANNASSYEHIAALNGEDDSVHISWAPNNQYVALYEDDIAANTADVYPIGFNSEDYRSLKVAGRDIHFTWSPTGNVVLYSAYSADSNYNPTLWVANSSPELIGTGRNKLQIDTWADKCTFASDYIVYCAVPTSLDPGTGFRPDLADSTADYIYVINIKTNQKSFLAKPLFPTTIGNIIVSKDGKELYWLEKNTGQIKKMNL